MSNEETQRVGFTPLPKGRGFSPTKVMTKNNPMKNPVIAAKTSGENHVSKTNSDWMIKIVAAHNTPEFIESTSKRMIESNPMKRPEQRARITGENNVMKRPEVKAKHLIVHNTPEFIAKISGENSPNWINGNSNFPYPITFNERFKEFIRERDDKICQGCSKIQEEELKQYGRKHAINHIDFNKENTTEFNCNTMCGSCNARINSNRTYWTNFFQMQQFLKAMPIEHIETYPLRKTEE